MKNYLTLFWEKHKDYKSGKILRSIPFLIIAFLLLMFLPLGNEKGFHIDRMESISMEMWTRGISGMPYRIYSNAWNGYGTGIPLIFGDLFLYIPGAFIRFGASPMVAKNLFLLMVVFGSYHSFFTYYKKYILAGIYSLIPIFWFCYLPGVYVGDSAFFVFLPMVVGALYFLLFREKSKRILCILALGLSGCFLSWNLGGFVVFLLAVLVSIIKFSKFSRVFLGFIFFLGICAFSYLPFIELSLHNNFSLGNPYPKNVAEDFFESKKEETIVSNYKETKISFKRYENMIIHINFSKNPGEKMTLELPLIMYPGYVAVNTKTNQEYSVRESKNGRVLMEIGDEKDGTMDVFFRGTPIQNYSVLVSAVSLILLLIYVNYYKGEEK